MFTQLTLENQIKIFKYCEKFIHKRAVKTLPKSIFLKCTVLLWEFFLLLVSEAWLASLHFTGFFLMSQYIKYLDKFSRSISIICTISTYFLTSWHQALFIHITAPWHLTFFIFINLKFTAEWLIWLINNYLLPPWRSSNLVRRETRSSLGVWFILKSAKLYLMTI